MTNRPTGYAGDICRNQPITGVVEFAFFVCLFNGFLNQIQFCWSVSLMFSVHVMGSTDCRVCGLSPHCNAVLSRSFLLRVSAETKMMFHFAYLHGQKGIQPVPAQYWVPLLAAPCFTSGAQSQCVEKWTGCGTQQYLCEFALHAQVFGSICNGVVLLRSYQSLNVNFIQDSLPGQAGWGTVSFHFRLLNPCDEDLVLCTSKNRAVDLVPRVDLPIAQDHISHLPIWNEHCLCSGRLRKAAGKETAADNECSA